MSLASALRTLFNPARPDDLDHCEICGTYIGTAGHWDTITLTCGADDCDDLAMAQRTV